jgi:hypothetical protein
MTAGLVVDYFDRDAAALGFIGAGRGVAVQRPPAAGNFRHGQKKIPSEVITGTSQKVLGLIPGPLTMNGTPPLLPRKNM